MQILFANTGVQIVCAPLPAARRYTTVRILAAAGSIVGCCGATLTPTKKKLSACPTCSGRSSRGALADCCWSWIPAWAICAGLLL